MPTPPGEFYKLVDAVRDVLGFQHYPRSPGGRREPAGQFLVKPGDVVPMNAPLHHHQGSLRANAKILGDLHRRGPQDDSTHPFRGNIDIQKLKDVIAEYGADKVSFVRMEATTNLIGGQPFSMRNLREAKEVASAHGIPLVFDGSLISEQAYFIRQREEGYSDKTIGEILKEMMSHVDLLYLSGRKSTAVRGGLIATNRKDLYDRILPWLPVYEGFATYGGMSTKEVEAMAVGIREMTDLNVAGAAAEFVRYCEKLLRRVSLR